MLSCNFQFRLIYSGRLQGPLGIQHPTLTSVNWWASGAIGNIEVEGMPGNIELNMVRDCGENQLREIYQNLSNIKFKLRSQRNNAGTSSSRTVPTNYLDERTQNVMAAQSVELQQRIAAVTSSVSGRMTNGRIQQQSENVEPNINGAEVAVESTEVSSNETARSGIRRNNVRRGRR